MAQATQQQTYKNHTRFDPGFHFLLAPLILACLVVSILLAVRHPGVDSILLVVLVFALLLAAGKTRGYSLRVQDRVIRLEERLRLSLLLPAHEKARIPELTESQLIALRFASDDELPALAMRAVNEGLTSKQIKAAIESWRPDMFRV